MFDRMLFAGDSMTIDGDSMTIGGDSMTIDGDKLDFAMRSFSVDVDANRRSVAQIEADG